jgi:hypothetical protein
MNNSPIKTLRLNGKTIQPQDLPAEAWNIIMGGEQSTSTLQDYFSNVSWVYRGIDIRANGVKRVPFVIENRGGNTIDDSTQYTNAVGILPKPKQIIGLTEMALSVFGYAYWYRTPNLLGKTMGVRYLLPTDIDPDWQRDVTGRVVGLQGFRRKKYGKFLPLDEIVYFWKDDPFVEAGPPESSPLKAAAREAGVILNVNKFAELYFERGAIKGTILAITGNPPPQEKQRIKSLWGRLMKGMSSLFGEMVVNADSIKPIVIGEGLEALSDKNLTGERREAIATALGIPHSVLFSGASNFAVSTQDEKNLYDQTLIPEAEFIEEIINDQLLLPLGYRLRFTPETMDIYQEDEAERAGAMSQFMDALDKAGSFEMAQALFKIYGIEVDDESMGLIDKHYQTKAERGQDMSARLQSTQIPQQPMQFVDTNKRTDLDRWRTFAINRIKAGKSLDGFTSDEIPLSLQAAIAGALEAVQTVEGVVQIFDNDWLGYP